MTAAVPYRVTPVFDELTLPAGLRREHRTKAGVWGIIRMLDGAMRLASAHGVTILTPDSPGMVEPEEAHWVEPLGPMRMQVEFYDGEPALRRN